MTSLVKAGGNALGGFLGNGWYCGHIGNGGYQAWGKVPALFAQLEVTLADGTVKRIVTDGSWKTHASPIVSSDFMLGENYDAAGGNRALGRAGAWTSALGCGHGTIRAGPARSTGQVDQPVRETAERHPQAMTEPKPGQYTFDLGQNMVGFVRLKVTAPAGTKITLRHAEMLNPDGTIYYEKPSAAPLRSTPIYARVAAWKRGNRVSPFTAFATWN